MNNLKVMHNMLHLCICVTLNIYLLKKNAEILMGKMKHIACNIKGPLPKNEKSPQHENHRHQEISMCLGPIWKRLEDHPFLLFKQRAAQSTS